MMVGLLAGCRSTLSADGKTYPTYGLINESTDKSSKVCYELCFGNAVWGVLLVETLIGPVYFFGYDLYEPVRLKNGPEDQCTIDG